MRSLAAAWALASCVLALGVEASEMRAFPINHHEVRDAAAFVEPLLSKDGSMTIQPQFNLLTVRDSVEVIKAVERALATWDVPPPTYRVSIRVLLGTTAAATPGPAPPPAKGFTDELSKVFHFTSYQEIETVQVTAAEGSTVEADAGTRYHMRFALRSVANDPERVQLGQFEVARRDRVAGGGDSLRPLLRTTVSLQVGQVAIVGLARAEGASQGLVLVLSAERGPR